MRFTLTTLFNIPGTTGTISGSNPLVSPLVQGNSAGSPDLADLFGILFSQVSGTPMPAVAGATPANAADKIADLLNLSSTPAAKKDTILNDLFKKLGFTPQEITAFKKDGVSTDDLLKKILQNILGTDASTPADIKPALLRDLTSGYTTDIQTDAQPSVQTASAAAPTVEDILATSNDADAAPTDDMAALMNSLEPGADNAPDESVLSSLKDKLKSFIDDKTPVTADRIAQFKEDVVQFLNDHGITGAQVHKYLGLLTSFVAHTQDTAAHTSSPALPQADVSLFAKTKATDGGEKPQHLNTLYTIQENADGETAPETKVPAAPQKPDTQASVDTSPKSSVAKPMTAQFISQLMKDGNDTSTADDWKFSFDKNAFGQHDALGHGKAATDTSLPGFSNYMAAAKSSATPNLQMIVMQIQKNAITKAERMTIQLSPAELGNLEIRMKFEKDGNVKTHLIADKAETFTLLQKDSQQLHRALQQAGIDVDENSLSFDLRQDSQEQRSLDDARSNGSNRKNYGNDIETKANDNATTANIAATAYGYITRAGVNIMV